MISYAQAREDVLLDRALRHVPHEQGFYIDVGGFDPDHDSVTKHFYEHGWRGINIEPTASAFPKFEERRPRDKNLQVAVSDYSGEATFYEVVGHEQLCTLETRFAEMHASTGHSTQSYKVPVVTLTQICDEYVDGEIHFLKIDVEGHEHAVIRGMDFNRYRPWVLVIEATVPNNNHISIFNEWHDRVDAAGYELGHTDVLNRYYVARERADLLPKFALPADDYTHAWMLRERDEARRERDEALRELASLSNSLQKAHL